MLSRSLFWNACLTLVGFVGLTAGSALAEDTADAQKNHQTVVAKGVAYLKSHQAEDGSFTSAGGPGVTAMVTCALLRSGVSPEDPVVAKALKYIDLGVNEDGGLGKSDSPQRNYETCLAVMAWSEANKDGRFSEKIKKAEAFLKGLQWDEGENKNKEDFFYGGAGYGKSKRPDLSNTTFLIDALKSAGRGADDEAIQRALIFVSRSQNLESEFNTTPFPAKNPDGGFYYTPAAGGVSQAKQTENGGLRSYGSMTYAGLKSMIYAGVKADDKRVQAAVAWLKKNYDVKNNPGMKQEGLFYYYHTFAKCLAALGSDTFEDAKGVKHDWRSEVLAELAARQKSDGSFVNEQDRFLEGDPNIVTSYALLAASYAKPASK